MYKVFIIVIYLWLYSGKIYIEKKNLSKLYIKYGSKLYLKICFKICKIKYLYILWLCSIF